MAKYRILSKEELEPLEKEFIDFLVLNGITGDDWVKMKENDEEAAVHMTELFSDVVWSGILRKITHLDHRASKSIKCFQCLEERIVLVSIDSEKLDLLSSDFNKIKNGETSEGISVYSTYKPYNKSREEELYDMLGWGCEPSDGELFKQLCLLL